VPSPHSGVSRGEPQAKLLGAFSLVRFFGASKEMNVKFLNFLGPGFRRNEERNAADRRFGTAC